MEEQEKQYDALLNTALDKIKTKYKSKIKDVTEHHAVESRGQQDQFRAQLDALNQELEAWKHKASILSNTSQIPSTNVPTETRLGALKQEIFNYCIYPAQSIPIVVVESITPRSIGTNNRFALKKSPS